MLTVQEEKVEATPQTPLPTEYWTRPINSQNFDWYTISGNWLGTGAGGLGGSAYNATGNFNPYTTAPNTGHIMWTKPLMIGGLIGGEFGGSPISGYYSGKSYEKAFSAEAIINGVLYYNAPSNNPADQGFYAVDLRTGETLWHQNAGSITNGQVYNYISPNQEGGVPYLWSISGSTWSMYDANTGNLILQIENATSGPTSFLGGGNIVEGPNGELLVYVLDPANNQLSMWNSSLCILSQTTRAWRWRPQLGAAIDWQNGVQWSVTIDAYPDESIHEINSGVILATTANLAQRPQSWQMEKGYDMTTGEQLWVQNRTTPHGLIAWGSMGSVGEGVYTEFDKGGLVWYGYSVYSGEQIWGPTQPFEKSWASLPTNDKFEMVAYGISYCQHLDGIHAINKKTGERLWDFYADPAGLDFPGYSTLPFENNMIYTIADGKVFAPTGDSHGVPRFRGAKLYAIDAYSGNEVWSINGYYQHSMPVADGYLVAFNAYDNQLYCFGKGPSSTAVTASPKIIAKGNSVLIEGTVTDQSPGTKTAEVMAKSPNTEGVPCVADGYQEDWMEYLYMQQECPAYYEGVDVKLEVLDPNGNFYEIGTVKSDGAGIFKKMWTPDIEGEYTIIATFEGSESYWRSYAETVIGVGPAEAPSGPIEPEPTEPTEAPFITTEIAILIAAVIVAAAVIVGFWIIRKRK